MVVICKKLMNIYLISYRNLKIALGIAAASRASGVDTADSPTGTQWRERPNKTYFQLHPVFYTLLICILMTFQGYSQVADPLAAKDRGAQQRWVDSVYNSMSLKEKIGQLFMPAVFSRADTASTNKIKRLIEEYHIGGIIFSKGGPVRQARLINDYQSVSKVPLMIAMDAEWGLAMRLDSTFAYPWNMTLGAVEDDKLIEKVGYRIGMHLKRQGVHINFAPDVDINTNPDNPIIGNRSFGEDKENVTRKSSAFTRGMQKAGVLACAKHFPGHGDTDKDSHKTLPTIGFSRERIDKVELYPYKQLIKENLASVMIAHLNVPSLESREGYPSSISRNIVTNLLKKELQFKGLIFTDALNMKGASDFTGPGDIDLQAFLAGNDMLLISGDIPKGVQKIEEAYNKNIITEQRLAHSVKKILRAKYKTGLHEYKPVEIKNIVEELNTMEDRLLYDKVVENTITIVKNEEELLPLKALENKRIAYVGLGDDSGDDFLKHLQKYAKVDHIQAEMLDEMLIGLAEYNTVVIGLHRSNANPWKAHKFTNMELVWLHEIARIKKVVLAVFVKPYALLDVFSTENIETVVLGYQNSKTAQEKAAEVIFGALGAKGMLPVTANEDFPVKTSIKTKPISRLRYGIPESVGVNSGILKKVDSMARIVIDSAMAPGAQILIARKGKVIYHKAFGKHTYDTDRKVELTDLYDVASLTKILASLPMIMKLEETGKLSLQSKLKDLLPELKGTNKADLTVLEILSHYGKLKPWIPFYIKTLDTMSRKPMKDYYSRTPSGKFSVKVTEDLYLRKDYEDSIFQRIVDTDLRDRLEYRYSDLPFFFFKRYIEKTYGKSLDHLAWKNLYQPIGANYTTYNPLKKFKKDVIVPSEEDNYYRYQTIQGYVHDMGAAMQGGVGGHAGLFANANDIAKIMQMYLQKGFYGGKRYFKTKTIDKFNKCYFCKNNNRRGVGFDKPQLGEVGPTCGCVSMTSFGHSGFTGTYAWADPENEIVYVFLSNRTYPTATNRKLITEGVRTVIQQIIYDAITE